MAVPVALIIAAAAAAASASAAASSRDRQHESNAEAQDTLSGTKNYAQKQLQEGHKILEQQLDWNEDLYGDRFGAKAELDMAKDALNSVDPYKATAFNYDKQISDFFDPAFQLSVDNANQSINESQALGGNLFSGDTAQKIAAQNQVLASQMYNEALNSYRTDKGLEQGIWAGNEAARQAEASSAANLANMKYGMAADSVANVARGNDAYYQGLLGLNEDYWQNKADYAAQMAQLQAADPGKREWYEKFFDPAGLFT